MDDTKQRLSALHPTIQELMSIAGTAGLSLGVLHHGETIHVDNFGFRNIELQLPVDDETVFPGCSLTKAMVSAAMAMLVEEGALTWDTLVKDILPDFYTKDDVLHNMTTITDLLSHRTGMSTSNYWLGSQNNILIRAADSMKFLNNQQLVKPFRGQWQYNNLGYEIAGHVIDKISGMTWSQMLKSRIFEPLDLQRTGTHTNFQDDDNVASAYGTLDDATPTEIDKVKAGENTFGGANGGVRSCVKDLLKLYMAIMGAGEHQYRTGETSTPESPLKQVSYLLSSHIPLTGTSLRESSYACGWVRAQLPGPMGAVGLNPKLMPDGMPIVAQGSQSQLMIYHQGSLPGALAAVNLLPDTQSAIVVMTNSLALNDCADWVGQLVLESLLDTPSKNDYVQAAKSSVSNALAWHSALTEQLKKEQKEGTSPKYLNAYSGVYHNSINTIEIEVTQESHKLYFALQGLATEKYELTHYQDDVFTWLQSRNHLARRGRFTHQTPLYYQSRFQSDSKGNVYKLMWTHDSDVPEGEEFSKIK